MYDTNSDDDESTLTEATDEDVALAFNDEPTDDDSLFTSIKGVISR